MKIFVLLLFTISSSFLLAQELTLPLWPDGVPNYRDSGEEEKLEITDRLKKISYVQNPDISVFMPAKGNATGDAVIICPGGGYWILAYDWEGTDIAKYFNSKGITAIVLKYRLPVSKSNIEPHKSPLMDAQRAIRTVRFNAEKWNINPNRIGIMGFSAGGHLASTAGTHYDEGSEDSEDPIERVSSRPDFMALIYPVISFDDKYGHSGSKKALLGDQPDPALVKYFSNELHVTEDTPPTILIHSQDDKGVSVKNSLVFYDSLLNKGVSSEMHLYPYGGHGYSLAVEEGYLSTWIDRVTDWIKRKRS